MRAREPAEHDKGKLTSASKYERQGKQGTIRLYTRVHSDSLESSCVLTRHSITPHHSSSRAPLVPSRHRWDSKTDGHLPPPLARARSRHMAVDVLREAARRPAAEAQAASAVPLVVAHPKEVVAEGVAVDPVVPRRRLRRERLGPSRTREVHGTLVVEVQELELDVCVRGMQVDLEGVRARRAVEGADAAERGPTEGTHKGRLVVAVGMADKAAPESVSEAVTHVLGEARGGGADERTPALLGPTRAQLEPLRDGG